MDEAFKSTGIFILHVWTLREVRGPEAYQTPPEVLIDPLLKADMATFQELFPKLLLCHSVKAVDGCRRTSRSQ